MSSKIQDKLLSMEVPPPPGVWDKIAAELEQSTGDRQYADKLYELAVAPPAGVWDKIATSLDEGTGAATLAAKLAAHEVAPPAGTWKKIAATLDAEHEAAIPERRRLAPYFRYAAAAAVIALIAWGGISLFNKKQNAESVAVSTQPDTKPGPDQNIPAVEQAEANQQDVTPQQEENIATANSDDARNDAALEASKRTYASLDSRTSGKIKQAADFYFGVPAGTTRSVDINENYNSIPVHTKDANRYITLMTPEGNIIRMSKKLSSLVCCVSGEEQDKECMEQINKWREKIACSPAGHSPGNFMDILSLLNTLQENDEL
ncbi:MAG: hypothetical protein JNM88_13110 [Chitinophagaceae bacterium]|nr:hypothetical protein [Chitinophagaceae bacterium]